MSDEFTLEDILIVIQRRFYYFVVPAMLIVVIGAATIFMLPAKFTARGTILVESQQIPSNLIQSTINAYAQERIRTIQQRVMTRSRLLEIANKYSLFPAETGLSESERVARVRRGMNVQLITAPVNRRAQSDGTIAFTVSFTHEDPEKAYLVANEFMTLFLSEDIRTRTAGASNTTEFFEREARRLREAVAEVETQINEYKAQNSDALPEHLNLHIRMLEKSTQQFSNLQTTVSQLEEQRRFLESQLVSGVGASSTIMQAITQAEADLAQLRSRYHDNYPLVIAKREEIESLRARLRPSGSIQRLRRDLEQAEIALIAAERANPRDPVEIARLEARLESARAALSEQIARETGDETDITRLQLEGQLAAIESRLRLAARQSAALEEEIRVYQERIERTSQVDRGLAALTRDYNNLYSEYQELLTKQQDAQLAENLEENQQAEKFSILEPAERPDAPSSPNRPQLLFITLVAATGVGSAIVLALELLNQTVRGRNHIANLIDDHPVAVIPYIHTRHDRRPRLPFGDRKSHGIGLAAEPAE